MNIEDFRAYCLTKAKTTEEFPFDKNTLVFKVMGKIFALTSLSNWESGCGAINLKCNPEKALLLREQYESISEGFHMNKKHWNTVQIDGTLSVDFLKEMIDHSYEQVLKGLPKKLQQELKQ